MTREQAMCKLLRHGGLTVTQAVQICCWPAGEAEKVMHRVHGAGLVKRVREQVGNMTVFRLTERGSQLARDAALSHQDPAAIDFSKGGRHAL